MDTVSPESKVDTIDKLSSNDGDIVERVEGRELDYDGNDDERGSMEEGDDKPIASTSQTPYGALDRRRMAKKSERGSNRIPLPYPLPPIPTATIVIPPDVEPPGLSDEEYQIALDQVSFPFSPLARSTVLTWNDRTSPRNPYSIPRTAPSPVQLSQENSQAKPKIE